MRFIKPQKDPQEHFFTTAEAPVAEVVSSAYPENLPKVDFKKSLEA